MNKPGDAVTNLKKAIELNGDRFDYHSGLAQVLYTQRKFPQVISALKSILHAYKFGETGRGRSKLGILNATGCSSVWTPRELVMGPAGTLASLMATRR